MRITVPDLSAPVCKCGGKMEIYLDVYMKKIRTKCIYCGYERSTFVAFEVDLLH